MKQRANRRRSVVRPSPVVAATVSPPPKMVVPSSVDASEPSAVATSPNWVVSPNSDPSLAMAVVLVLPTVAEMSPSPPSTSLPEVVTASSPPVSPTVGVVNAHPPCSVGKTSPPIFASSSKRVTRSSVVSESPPGESSPLPNPNPPSPSPPKSPSMSKHSSPKTPKTRSAFKSKPKPKPHVPAQSKGKGKLPVSSPPKKSSAPKRKPKDTQFVPSPKKSKRASSPTDSVSFVDPSSIQYFVDATKASHYQRWFVVRDLWPEYSVVLEDFPDLVALLQCRHWVNTVSKLVSPHPILIGEFYANLDRSVLDGKNEDCLIAFVRGSRIKFAPSTIARALKVPKVLKPAYNKSYSPDQSTMGQVLTGLPDYVWGNHDIPITKLTLFYRVLHRVALYNWFPNSHLSSVTLEIGKFLYAVGTGVSIDLSTLIYDRIFYVASSTGTRNKLPYPSLIQKIIQPAKPSLTTHDFQVANPILSKSFLAILNKKVSSTAPSSLKPSKLKAPLFKGLSDSSWQVQLYTEFKAFTKRYKKDQKRQLAFEASMYKLVQVVKTLVVQSEYGSQLSPSIDVSPPAFHRDSFGESSVAPESSVPIQRESFIPTQVSSQVPPVSSIVPPANTKLDTLVPPTLPDVLPQAPDSTAPLQGEPSDAAVN
ncbi:uncharacterized protein LOC133791444 [Humulus lupulus]|uniref:uncharacterized protein LOC133791444 n=1 Tax=Humulus lupulus TaxID=3486 RepID=UPI002B410914|nr:uncharacterized protein LOC133791444 [Humulus lupulus]